MNKEWIVDLELHGRILDHSLQVLELEDILITLVDTYSFCFEDLGLQVGFICVAFRAATREIFYMLVRSQLALKVADKIACGYLWLTFALNRDNAVRICNIIL